MALTPAAAVSAASEEALTARDLLVAAYDVRNAEKDAGRRLHLQIRAWRESGVSA